MNAIQNNLQRAHATAAQRAAEALKNLDLPARCARLGLPAPAADGTLSLRAFGKTWVGFVPSDPHSAPEMHPVERVLVLHYLLCEGPVAPTGRLISFTEFPRGQFYYGPFSARTTVPLVRRVGHDLPALRRNLSRFDHQLLPGLCSSDGDLAARIHAVGRIKTTLIYRAGDEETPAAADILFDECTRRVFNTEDAVALASRICLGLL